MDAGQQLARSQDIANKVSLVFHRRARIAQEHFQDALRNAYARNDIRELAASPSPDHRRLVALQHALLDLIDFLDDPPTRFPQEYRTRL